MCETRTRENVNDVNNYMENNWKFNWTVRYDLHVLGMILNLSLSLSLFWNTYLLCQLGIRTRLFPLFCRTPILQSHLIWGCPRGLTIWPVEYGILLCIKFSVHYGTGPTGVNVSGVAWEWETGGVIFPSHFRSTSVWVVTYFNVMISRYVTNSVCKEEKNRWNRCHFYLYTYLMVDT